ncbi:MAG TPA: hypothetical protein PKE29_05090 [Phycisphaerales bacterium]|mgnify:CR=1 FL=1|nr:hypothetical protein [Phycisphaerales bacterium]
MNRCMHGCLCLLATLVMCTAAMAQPKLILTGLGSDLSNDGNTTLGTILDENVYARVTAYTRGAPTGTFLGPVIRGYDGALKMSDLGGPAFYLSAGLYNGFYGTTPWPQSNPGLFGNYVGTRPCCNGTTCVVMDASQCLPPNYSMPNTSSCSPNPCPTTPPTLGGCCNALSGVCLTVPKSSCVSPNYWIGGDLTCGNYPCSHGHNLPFRYDSSTDSWTNCGGIPNNTGGPGLGASKCDAGIATPYGISSTGQFIVGGSWYGAFGTTGCSTRGFVYNAADGTTQMLPLIGTGAGCQNFSQAWDVSADGNYVLGRDTHATTDPAGAPLSCNSTCLALWERDTASGQFFLPRPVRACCNGGTCTLVDPATCTGTSVALFDTTCTANPCPPVPNPPASGACCNADSLSCKISDKTACGAANFWIGNGVCSPRNPCLPATEILLDTYGAGSLTGAVMTRLGTIVAAPLSSGAATYDLSDSTQNGALCRYVRNPSTGVWVRTVLGFADPASAGNPMVPRAISDDGNTIIGVSQPPFSSGLPAVQFIWKPTLNGGVPMEFGAYLQSLNGGQPFPSTGGIGMGGALSADGNALLVSWGGPGPEACPVNTGLTDLSRGGVLYLDGSSIPCQPPVIFGGPYDKAQLEYSRFGMVGNVFFAGSFPITAQWQHEEPSFSNNWVDMQDSCGQFTLDNTWTYEGTHGYQLRVNMLADSAARDGRFRVVLTNSCGSATSAVANMAAVIGACCYYDINTGGTSCLAVMGTRCTSSVPFGLAGVYLGDGTACAPSGPCDSVIGACCFFGGGVQCVADISTHCELSIAGGGLGGVFRGPTTTCAADPTCATVSGACCYSFDGLSSVQCTVELTTRCTQSPTIGGFGGAYSGHQVACAPGDSCPTSTAGVGACCFNATATTDVLCAVHISSHCTSTYFQGGLQGQYRGDGTTCSANICKPGPFGLAAQMGACVFTDPNFPASGPLCIITYKVNCDNYPNGSNDANTGPFNTGLGGNFYVNTCCGPSSSPPISGCSTSPNITPSLGACIHTPLDNSTPAACTVQVRPTRCTRKYNQGGLFGTWVANTASCSPAVFTANAGACCYTTAASACPVCTIQPIDRCTTTNNGGLSGVYSGNGTVCEPTIGCPPQWGACCTVNGANFTCAVVARSACTGTLFGLDLRSCEVAFCPTAVSPAPSGACCNATSLSCTVGVQAACTAPNFWIYNAACTAVNACTQPGIGACCVGTFCSVTCQEECVNTSGIPQGAGTACSPTDPCAAPAGVCCRGSTCSTAFANAAACAAALDTTSGTVLSKFVPGSAICNTPVTTPGSLGNTTSPCCYANYNHNASLEVQDIFDFLNDWFAGKKGALVGGDGTSGTLSVQNIFDFLNSWFAGGCN